VLDDRKSAILRAIVEEYIRTAQPVGSAHVARMRELGGVSAATVRNEMGVLEKEGFLTHPHTSAGRVPTDLGYRFFVDHLRPAWRLDPAHSQKVRSFFSKAHGELEQLLVDTTRLVSTITECAAVVTHLGEEQAHVLSTQLVTLSTRVVLSVAVLANGSVIKRTLELDRDVGEEELARASARLSSLLVGRPVGSAQQPPPSGDEAVDALVGAAVTALGQVVAEPDAHPQVYVGGAARMAEAFDTVGTVRKVLDILEQQYVLVSLIRDLLDRGLTVAIGREHGVQPLAECSVVLAPYEIEGEQAGTVGILGPTRMHYEQTMAAVAMVSKRLSQTLSETA
jgi:heat-inducible transcriptional repressor